MEQHSQSPAAGDIVGLEQVADNSFKAPDAESVKEEMEREFSRPRARGFVIHCDGEHATIFSEVKDAETNFENYWCVGQLITIKVGLNRVVGLCCAVDVPKASWAHEGGNALHITVELVGEIYHNHASSGDDRFTSGITNYPPMGSVAHRIRAEDLEIIYRKEGEASVSVGNLTQDETVSAKIDVDKLLSRHFAVVGTTGVGKSSAVTLLLRKVIKTRSDVRVLMLDPHNEFANAFPSDSVVVDPSNLLLPFWLFKLDEICEVVFRGQTGFENEAELLRDLIPLAKERYKQETSGEKPSSLARRSAAHGYTADAPVPYRMADLLDIISERLGLLDGKVEKPFLKSLQYRLESIIADPRFKFMFDQAIGGDVMEEVIAQIFRVPSNGKPICVLEMSGLPSEVVDSVVSVLCRMAFELAMTSDGAIQTLVVCEEAHRYIPADRTAGFWPTRQSIARIAKEGRKYGVYLSIISQRPGELDPTILSQCNTVFAMRLGNDKDQEIIRGAVTNGAKSTIGFLSSIANRECIAFGEAIHTPMRMTFETIAAEDLPGARIYKQQEAVREGKKIPLSAIVRKMRLEDRRHPSDEFEETMSRQFLAKIPDVVTSKPSPGDDINDILNAVYPTGKSAEPEPIQRENPPSLSPDGQASASQYLEADELKGFDSGQFGTSVVTGTSGTNAFVDPDKASKDDPRDGSPFQPTPGVQQPQHGSALKPSLSGKDLLKTFRSG